MIDLKITFVNVAQVLQKLSKLPGKQAERMTRTLDRWTLSVLRDSKTKPPRVPVDTGALQSSGVTEPAQFDGKTLRGAITYGGIGDVDYAVYVHDNASGRIKNYHRPGSGPLFVSTHWDARKPELQANFEKDLGDAAKDLFG